jgi:hypothetical protein
MMPEYHLHIISCGAEPLEEKDGEGGDLNGSKCYQQPRCGIKGLCKRLE